MEKSELDPKQVFDFVGYKFDLKEGKVRPTLDLWQTLTAKIQELLTGSTCPVQQLMSLIGLLTATEIEVHPGGFHMRPIQLYQKNKIRWFRFTRKVLKQGSQIAPPTSEMVAGGKQCASRSTITPTKTCSADLYRCIKRRLERLLKRTHSKGNLIPSRKQTTHELPGTNCLDTFLAQIALILRRFVSMYIV